MTTLNEMIEIIKAENPTLQVGDDEQGYTELTASEYDEQVLEWATNRLAKLTEQAEAEAAKAAAQAKLAALGLTTDDLKALGLGGN
jgi:hypothetical protein